MSTTEIKAPDIGDFKDVEVTEVLVLGSGPGGYTAAFRAADLGKKVILVERYADLGGVCTNVGCIPSKALLHVARVIAEARELAASGVGFAEPVIDLDKLRAWKAEVAGKGAKGIAGLARQRKVAVVQGVGRFESANTLLVTGPDGKSRRIAFDACIIAAGSSVARITGLPYEDPRLIDSTGALALADIPKRLLVIGGGIIGLEMACVYDALGSRVSVVEMQDGLMPGADRDLVRPLERRLQKRYEAILLKTRVAKLEPGKEGLLATFDGPDAPSPQTFDRVLLATGRRPNGRDIGAELAGVMVNERGFIPVDRQMRTNVPHIFAIGDIVGEPMLAHKASHEAKVAAEVIAGHKAQFDALTIPSVAYTDPEVAWMGLTESAAKTGNIPFEKAVFPWAASGRARAVDRTEGSTKLLYDPETKRILGAGIVGPNAGELIAELVLALEMGADMNDISLTIHPHPTLSETAGLAAELALGTITDLMAPRRK
jgi:dihydrolipoamide dehydrogenase